MRNDNLGDRMKTYENVTRTLFRGKCKTDNKWLYGFPYVTRKNAVKINWYCSEFGSMRTDEVIPETVGQYTGLDVANGNVFDGDYLKFGAYILEVFWNGETFQWQAGKVGRSYDIPFRCCGNYRGDKWTVIDLGEIAAEPIITGQMTTEIVGNRWDNPELLPQKSKCEWDLF